MSSKDLWNISKQFTNFVYSENNEAKITIFNCIINWLEKNANNTLLLQEAIIYCEQCGNTPLHFILLAEAPSYGLVDAFLSIVPDVTKIMNKCKDYPLHIAAEYKASYEDITAIFRAFPDAIKHKGNGGRLPLHLACQNEDATNIISMLAQLYPEAIKEADNAQQLPIHFVCCLASSFKSVDIIEMFLKEYPESKNFRSNFLGFLPTDQLRTNNCLPNNIKNNLLHEALHRGRSKVVIEFFLVAFPEQYKQRNGRGRIPLHYACASRASNANEYVMFMLKLYGTRYLFWKDALGITPIEALYKRVTYEDVNSFSFHHLVRNSECLYYKGLSALVTAYPNSLHLLDNSGLLPFHHACLNSHASIEALMWFIKRTPEVFKQQM